MSTIASQGPGAACPERGKEIPQWGGVGRVESRYEGKKGAELKGWVKEALELLALLDLMRGLNGTGEKMGT